MTITDIISILSLVVALFAAFISMASASEIRRSNADEYRKNWFDSYQIMLRAVSKLTMPSGHFSHLTEEFRRGYPLPLDESLVGELWEISVTEGLWSDLDAHQYLKNALDCNRGLDDYITNCQQNENDLTPDADFKLEAAKHALSVKTALESAIEIFRARLKESAPSTKRLRFVTFIRSRIK